MPASSVTGSAPAGGLRLPRPFATLPPLAWAYWGSIVVPVAIGMPIAAAGVHDPDWFRFLALATGSSVAQLSSVRMGARRTFHPAIVFVVAAALVLPPEQLVLMCFVQHVPEWLKQRYAWYVQPFNIANYVLAALAAWGATHLVSEIASGSGHPKALAGGAAAAAFVAVNRLLLAPMLHLSRGLSLRDTRLLAVDDVALELVLALMAVPFVALAPDHPGLGLFCLAPLVLIYFTQRATSRLQTASETIGRQNESLEEANRLVIQRSTAALEALSATVDARDKYTAGHSKRVAAFSSAIAAQLGVSGAELETVSQAALLHDIGKIGVPDAVLLKEGSLSQSDWAIMRTHPEEGARIIERLGFLDDVVPAIRHHHERPDGRGYPDGLIGEEIPLAARIIHVADALDAMTTERVYRDALSLELALAEIRRGRGTDFCVACADALEHALRQGDLGFLTPSVPRLVAS